jgi:co-chaperonin GroES (HSP10)
MILVAPLVVEEKTEGGIIIASNQVDREQMAVNEGVIVEWGHLAHLVSRCHGCAPGDLIGFAKYAGQVKTGLDGVEYRLIRGADIICRQVKPSLTPISARIPLDPHAEAQEVPEFSM